MLVCVMICPCLLCRVVTSPMYGKSGGELGYDNSKTVYNHCPLHKVKEDPISFCCHSQASTYAHLIVYQTNR